MNGERGVQDAAAVWDAAASTFDDVPDHGLRDPGVRAAWRGRLREWLPPQAGDVLDLGCGTGSLALLAAEQGHRVIAVDLSRRMAGRAAAKLAGTSARVVVGDAARPPVGEGRFDAVMARHVLWALPDPAAVLARWARLLRSGGRLVLVEGHWGGSERTGVPARVLAGFAAPIASHVHVEHLAHDSALWGRPVHDERYAVVVLPHNEPDTPHQAREEPGIPSQPAGDRT
jgi:ubiquinone/menaquinone biosynthesis C-methylase UbiE